MSQLSWKWKPGLANAGRSNCHTEPAEQAKNLTSGTRCLSPRHWQTSLYEWNTQRPKGLMVNELLA